MRVTITAWGLTVLDLRLLEQEEEDEEPAASGAQASTDLAGRYPLGFNAEPAPDRYPWEE